MGCFGVASLGVKNMEKINKKLAKASIAHLAWSAAWVLAGGCTHALPVVDEEPSDETVTSAAGSKKTKGCASDAKVVFSAPNDVGWIANIALGLVGEKLVYAMQDESSGVTVLRELSEGRGPDPLYFSPDPGSELRAMDADAEGIFVIVAPEDSPRDGTLVNTVALVPPAGGHAVPLPGAPHLEDRLGDPYIIGHDERFVYAGWKQTRIYRIDRGTGETTLLLQTSSLSVGFSFYASKIWWAKDSALYYIQADEPKPMPVKWGKFPSFCGLELRVNAGGVFCDGDRLAPDGTETALKTHFGGDTYYFSPYTMSEEHDGKVFVRYNHMEAPRLAEADPITLAYRDIGSCAEANTGTLVASPTRVYWSRGLTDSVVIESLAR
jgi:YHS domain-containing protein